MPERFLSCEQLASCERLRVFLGRGSGFRDHEQFEVLGLCAWLYFKSAVALSNPEPYNPQSQNSKL